MPWLQLILETDAAGADRLSEQLSEAGAAAVTLNDSADQPLFEPLPGATPLWSHTRVIGLFPAGTDMDALVGSLVREYAPQPLPPHRVELLEDQDWTRAWMDTFKPMRFGERLWIVPSWCEPPNPDGVNILLDPGLAFGTGTHATTRLCLEWLDGQALNGKEVLDYGCGSGILAIAAAKLGASHIRAVDIDPQALVATADNAARNRSEARIEPLLPEQLLPIPVDVLTANILAKPLIELAPSLSALVRPGGAMVLSGILPDQADAVAAAYRPAFEIGPSAEHDGWVRLSGTRTEMPTALQKYA